MNPLSFLLPMCVCCKKSKFFLGFFIREIEIKNNDFVVLYMFINNMYAWA